MLCVSLCVKVCTNINPETSAPPASTKEEDETKTFFSEESTSGSIQGETAIFKGLRVSPEDFWRMRKRQSQVERQNGK